MTSDNLDSDDAPAGQRTSVWLETTGSTDYGPLMDDTDVDVAIVGGGIAGISTAFDLVEAGRTVALIERGRILEGVTGNTTAKLTSQHGLIYDYLLEHVGEERARQYANANEAAIDEVESRVEKLDIDCEFDRASAYAYAETPNDRAAIRDEVEAAQRLGLPATFVESTPLPFDFNSAVRFDAQALFHPRKYLLSLAREVSDHGSHVFERTRALDVEDGDPCCVTTDRGDITADDVVIATHFPIVDPALYFARLVPKRSYVLAVRLRNDPPEGMYYRPGDPYFSVRPRPAGKDSTVLVGGQNHRTGHGNETERHYRTLERRARDRFDVESIERRWSTQDYVSVDRVPFVGSLAPHVDNVYVATGFGGWGLSNGTAAARILTDHILGRDNPWHEVYRPARLRFVASKGALLEHNRHAMEHFLEDRLTTPSANHVTDLEPGGGQVVDVDGESIGVSRDSDGELHAVTAVCPHMGCRVKWNAGERSWDCPCHGSRFDLDGRVLDTPAVEDLETFDVGDLF